SPLYTLLNSNNPPQASELPLVQSATAEPSGWLVSVNEEISQLQERLVQLRKDRIALARRQRRHEAILSSIRRVPPEILGEIFSWTLPCTLREALEPEDCDFDPTRSPWVLTHICSRWRAVAISIPSLWPFILLRYDRISGDHYPHKPGSSTHEYSRCTFMDPATLMPGTRSKCSNISLNILHDGRI
ncbi:hypothetical protein FB45DRAFT_763676, partial [Roridomyces roridus]